MDHPYRYLLNYCSALSCSPSIAQLAVSLVNESFLRTALCVGTPPELVAAGTGILMFMVVDYFVIFFITCSTEISIDSAWIRSAESCEVKAKIEMICMCTSGALHLSALLLRESEALPSHEQLRWWDALCLEPGAVERISHCIMDGLSAKLEDTSHQR